MRFSLPLVWSALLLLLAPPAARAEAATRPGVGDGYHLPLFGAYEVFRGWPSGDPGPWLVKYGAAVQATGADGKRVAVRVGRRERGEQGRDVVHSQVRHHVQVVREAGLAEEA